ncbi:MAG TPA: hypothetical protein VER39_16980 [Nocardioidaceae bacterium]|nr:hypothetical protein [Nocardioidaceae bacterium]
MTEAATLLAEPAVDLHDHDWRRVGSEVEAGILHYRCDLCAVTWSGPRPARPRDPRETGLRRG